VSAAAGRAPAGPTVGIGGLVASDDPGITIAALGLGSCIGVVIADPHARVAGLAHVMLPDSRRGAAGPPGRYADTAVPALLDAVRRLGAQPSRLVCAIAGGAQMLAAGPDGGVLRIGERNVRAVRDALLAAGLGVRGADTGGVVGRSLRVDVGSGSVTVCPIGGRPTPL
jgi:chemotaxis protein CheD